MNGEPTYEELKLRVKELEKEVSEFGSIKNEELIKYRGQLENIVNERTRELSKINEALQHKIIESEITEEALRESEEKYRNLVDLIPDPIAIIQESENKLINNAFTELFGYTQKDLKKGINIFDLVREQDRDAVRKRVKSRMAGKILTPRYDYIDLVSKDGKKVPCEVTGSLVNYERSPADLVIFRDITERRQSEEALRVSSRKFSAAFQSSPNAIVISNLKDGRIKDVNDSFIQISGYPREDVIGNTTINLGLWKGTGIRSKITQALQKDGTLRNFEVTFGRKSGELGTGFLSAAIIELEGEAFILGTLIDITERKRAEKELYSLRNLLSNIIDSMPSILVGVDADGKVTQWNKTAEQTTGIVAGIALGKTLSDVFPPMASEMEKITESIRTRETKHDLKKPRLSKDGTCYEDVIIYPLVANGVEGAVIRIDDVTNKVRMEEMMIQSEKMLSVGGLAAGMAHEINNPLAGIMQNVQVMKNRMSRGLQKNIATAEECGTSIETIETYMKKRGLFEMIELVMTSGKRAAKIVDNMLSFSRKSNERFAPHSLCDLLNKTLELAENDYDLKKRFDFRQIDILKEYDKATPHIMCEGSKIQQVFLNILKNGAQAMAEGKGRISDNRQLRTEGESEIGVPRFTLRVLPYGDMARIEIEDNGPGMDEETRKRVFEPFFTTKGVDTGTGLGLSVSYFIITENHGGTITVDSTPGKGAKFTILLPFG